MKLAPVAETIDFGAAGKLLEGKPNSVVLHGLTTLLASVLVSMTEGDPEDTTELTGVTCRNLETLAADMAVQHRLTVFRSLN